MARATATLCRVRAFSNLGAWLWEQHIWFLSRYKVGYAILDQGQHSLGSDRRLSVATFFHLNGALLCLEEVSPHVLSHLWLELQREMRSLLDSPDLCCSPHSQAVFQVILWVLLLWIYCFPRAGWRTQWQQPLYQKKLSRHYIYKTLSNKIRLMRRNFGCLSPGLTASRDCRFPVDCYHWSSFFVTPIPIFLKCHSCWFKAFFFFGNKSFFSFMMFGSALPRLSLRCRWMPVERCWGAVGSVTFTHLNGQV